MAERRFHLALTDADLKRADDTLLGAIVSLLNCDQRSSAGTMGLRQELKPALFLEETSARAALAKIRADPDVARLLISTILGREEFEMALSELVDEAITNVDVESMINNMLETKLADVEKKVDDLSEEVDRVREMCTLEGGFDARVNTLIDRHITEQCFRWTFWERVKWLFTGQVPIRVRELNDFEKSVFRDHELDETVSPGGQA